MLNPRIYRAALLPILFALVLAGFSLREQPRPLTATLAPDAFDGAAAFRELDRLAAAAPARRPGSSGDGLVAARVGDVLRRNGFRVRVERHAAQTVDGEQELQTVVGERAGFSARRIVVVAHRDALGAGARAELSGTAALLELARVLGGRTLGRTLVLASTSGGSGGNAGAAQLARDLDEAGTPVDAVIALGDLAGSVTRGPLVTAWSETQALAPLRLRRTVEAALATELGTRRPEGARPAVQLARLAVPFTLGEQGPFDARAIPAVLLSASGERPPAADAAVSQARLTAFGRAALRSVGALDDGPDVAASSPYLVLERKVLPAWPVRLLVLTLILPVLFASIDALARVRRRRERVGMWVRWLAASAMPFLLAALVAIGIFRSGLLEAAPSALAPAGAIPVSAAACVGVLAAFALGWVGLRPLLLRLVGVHGSTAGPGAAVATMLALCGVALSIWAINPYAALLLVPPLHLWLFAVESEPRLRRRVALGLFAAGLVPALLVAYAAMRQLGLDPLELGWAGLLLVAGGGIGPLAVLIWSIALGCTAAVCAIVLRGERLDAAAAPPVTVRGPMTYAGPGSLGGTESALRR